MQNQGLAALNDPNHEFETSSVVLDLQDCSYSDVISVTVNGDEHELESSCDSSTKLCEFQPSDIKGEEEVEVTIISEV